MSTYGEGVYGAGVYGAASGSGTASVGGDGALTAAGAASPTGAAALTGDGALSLSGRASAATTAGTAGVGALTATGSPRVVGTAGFGGAGALTTAARPAAAGQASPSGAGALTTGGAAPAARGSLATSGAGALSTSATSSSGGSAAVSGSGVASSQGAPATSGQAATSGVGSLAGAGGAAASGSVSSSGDGVLSTSAQQASSGAAGVSGAGTLSGDARPSTSRSVALSGAGALSRAPVGLELARNLAPDPRAVGFGGGTAGTWRSARWFGGSGATGTHAFVTGAGDGPALPGGGQIRSYYRKTWTATPSSNNVTDTGFECYQASGGTAYYSCQPGDKVTIGGWARPSSQKYGDVGAYWRDKAGAANGRTFGPRVDLPAGQWTWRQATYVVPDGVFGFYATLDIQPGGSSVPWAVGDTLDGTGLLVLVNGDPASPYFDGDAPDPASNAHHAWTGRPNQSPSVRRAGRAARRNVALIPRASAFVNTGGGFSNDRWTTRTTYSLRSDGGPFGIATYVRGTVTTEAGGLGFHLWGNPESGSNPDPLTLLPVVGGVPVWLSLWLRTSVAASAQIDVRPAAGATWLGGRTNPPATVTVAGEWTRIDLAYTPPANADRLSAYLVFASALPVGSTFDGTGLLVVPGATSAPSYFDGSSAPAGDVTHLWAGPTDSSQSVAAQDASAVPQLTGSVGLAGPGTLTTAAPAAGAGGTASLTGNGTFATTVVEQVVGTAATSGSGTLASSGAPRPVAQVSTSGTGSLTVGGGGAATGAAALTGAGSLADTGRPQLAGTLALGGAGSLAAAAVAALRGSVALDGSGTLASGARPGAAGAAALSGSGTAATAAVPRTAGTVALSGAGGLASAAAPGLAGTIALTGAGALARAAIAGLRGSVDLTGSGSVAPSPGELALVASLQLVGAGSLGSQGQKLEVVRFAGHGHLKAYRHARHPHLGGTLTRKTVKAALRGRVSGTLD